MCKWQRRSPEKETQEQENIGTEAFPSSVVAMIFLVQGIFFPYAFAVVSCWLTIVKRKIEAKQTCDSFPRGCCVDFKLTASNLLVESHCLPSCAQSKRERKKEKLQRDKEGDTKRKNCNGHCRNVLLSHLGLGVYMLYPSFFKQQDPSNFGSHNFLILAQNQLL